MTWGRLHDGMAFHPRIIAAGNEAVGLWARMLSYCNQHLTDGIVPRAVAGGLAGRYETHRGPLRKLIASGLAELQENGDILIHDYLQWNDSRSKILEKREIDAARKRRDRGECPPGHGTGRRAGVRSSTPTPTTTDLVTRSEIDRSLITPIQGRKGGVGLSDFSDMVANGGICNHLSPTEREWFSRLGRVDKHEIDHALECAVRAKARRASYLLKVIESERRSATDEASREHPQNDNSASNRPSHWQEWKPDDE